MLCFPNAKINIGLYVTEKRQDGFHNLESVFYPVEFCDILEIVPSDNSDNSLTLTGLEIPGNIEDNLVLKAAELLQKDFQLPALNINLHKIIPMGSGLGGGSSDAAFCLKLINKRFDLGLRQDQLISYALQLGSDCPFFIKNTPQFATGRGEFLVDSDICLSGKYILVVLSEIHVSTKLAFQGLNPQKSSFDLSTLNSLELNEWQGEIKNDFETSVFNMHPVLKETCVVLKKMGAVYCQMSGSGSSVFGIFNEAPSELSLVSKLNYKLFKIS